MTPAMGIGMGDHRLDLVSLGFSLILTRVIKTCHKVCN